jgi:hypothetical protein
MVDMPLLDLDEKRENVKTMQRSMNAGKTSNLIFGWHYAQYVM